MLNLPIIFISKSLKLEVNRKVLDQRIINSRTMAWRAKGANNEEFIEDIRGKSRNFIHFSY